MKFHKVFVCSGDMFQATVLALCAFGKLEWHWFWIVMVLEMMSSIGFEMRAERKDKETSNEKR